MKCLIDWCGKELQTKNVPFESWYCPECKIIYFLRDGILESIGKSDLA